MFIRMSSTESEQKKQDRKPVLLFLNDSELKELFYKVLRQGIPLFSPNNDISTSRGKHSRQLRD
ncbi:MAG: hypothetical protein JWO58_1091 [Chitinophagaceae bacterium]|nr:hypothetical protein [Chitinophagaceae bacterium]